MRGTGFIELDVLDGNGEAKEARLKFRNVLFVPGLAINPLSAYQLEKEGLHITASLIVSPAPVSQDDDGAATLSNPNPPMQNATPIASHPIINSPKKVTSIILQRLFPLPQKPPVL